jgi:uncharacterized membrane protein
MSDFIYEILQSIGYPHPIHPPLVHLPVGLVMAALIFSLAAIVLKRDSLAQTARHTALLALLALPVAAGAGFLDWQHFYGGAWLFPIQMKMILAAVLLVLLAIAAIGTSPKVSQTRNPVALYILCLIVVAGIGFFGGELVYGRKDLGQPAQTENLLVQDGRQIFEQKCAMCHLTDSTQTKVGPGLKGLYQRESLPVSDRTVSDETVRDQIRSPYSNMPAFPDLSAEQMEALLEYMKTL